MSWKVSKAVNDHFFAITPAPAKGGRGPRIPDPRPTDRWVLANLADLCDEGGKVRAATSTIARRTGLSRRGVQQAIARLEGLGLLTARRTQGGPSTDPASRTTFQIMVPEGRTPCARTGESGAPLGRMVSAPTGALEGTDGRMGCAHSERLPIHEPDKTRNVACAKLDRKRAAFAKTCGQDLKALTKDDFVDDRFRSATEIGVLPDTDQARLRVWAAAEQTLLAACDNAETKIALFVYLVCDPNGVACITNAADESAAHRIRLFYHGETSRRMTADEEVLT